MSHCLRHATRDPTVAPVRRATLALVALLLLSGCESTRNLWLGEPEDPPLPGEREPVLGREAELAADLGAGQFRPRLGEPVTNSDWPTPGGPADNQPGHVALSPGSLSRLWRSDIGAGSGGDGTIVPSPVIAGGRLYAMDAENQVTALDASSGARLWSVDTTPEDEDRALAGGVAVGAGTLVATTGFGTVRAMNPATGATVWERLTGAPARSAPAVAEDRVFIQTIDSQVIALAASDGQPLWAFTGALQRAALLGASTPAVGERLVVVGLNSGELTGLRLENGRAVWSESMAQARAGAALSRLPSIRARPIIDGGEVLALGNDDRLLLAVAGTGRRLWQRAIGGTETPALSAGAVFLVDNRNRLIALDRATGGIAWITQLDSFEDPEDREGPLRWHGPLIAGGQLRLVSSAGQLLAVDPDSGTVSVTQPLGVRPVAAPVIANGVLYVLDEDGGISAWR